MFLRAWLTQRFQYSHPPEQPPKHPIETFILKMLTRIDQQFFKGLELNSYSDKHKRFDTILHQIQRYLIRRQCKKFNKEFVRCIGEGGNEEDLIAIVCYLAVNSQLSCEIVDSILDLSSQDQRYLMQRYKEIESNLQKIVELKEVIQKIEAIEHDNSRLKDYYHQKQAQLESHIQQIRDLNAYNSQIKDQNQKYSREKQNALKELEIAEIQEFKQLCLFHYQHNTEITGLIERGSQDMRRLQQRSLQLKRQLHCYGVTIRSQIDQLQRLKSWYSIFQQQSLLKSQHDTSHSQSQLTLPLSDNKNILNMSGYNCRQVKGLLSDRTHCSSHVQRQDQALLKNNLGHLVELTRLQEEQLRMEARIIQLRGEIGRERERRRRLDGKISSLKKVQEEHVSAYFNISTTV